MSQPDKPASMNLNGTTLAPNVDPITHASAASLVNPINYAITKYSGTNAMTGFALPANFTGCFVVIPTAAVTGVTGGTYANDGTTASVPFGIAFTMAAARAVLFTCDGLLCYATATLT